MRLWSDSFENTTSIPAAFAMGQPDGFAANRNPHLAWEGVPEGTESFALLCIDPDAPTVPETVGREDVQIPVEQPRAHFIHWAMVDIAPDVRDIAAGSCSDGVTARGKQQPAGPAGARQGLNDYTGWFAGDAQMGGDYYGYDGPYPPFNDLRTHRYFFRLFALDVASLDVPARFTAGDVECAMQGHVLGEALVYGTYSLNTKVQG
ncbi:Raf kinase inhibitor-like YbhB/YbcL family protein [Pseudoxanthomonas japonensis]|uniref:YbhB/YbcL family Raf kinase inhibitor-like protein n=1 Tax=Pseudoxanthomonas japonensis TaxID=69284 RepID=UPI001A5CB132|nr:YbhB/YbcL family Raf kinase inhibitor-like protein [Pseudoxanthomonas japonensis]MBL8257838.1 YbhB/YbcL family Raf kinase inhibitor-like protein [Pseudoxanthomonas mexicana]MDR7068572.1 Raf kinase inhibitor-like YbhB/YbcL family protein [Pseudoxanthomonas japonensis]